MKETITNKSDERIDDDEVITLVFRKGVSFRIFIDGPLSVFPCYSLIYARLLLLHRRIE